MPEFTKTENPRPKAAPTYIWASFAFLAFFVYSFGLDIPFVGPDEPRYAQVAREMLERGDWITPTLGGYAWLEKPPLLYWLEIVSYKLFVINEFAARFGPTLFGLGTVASLWVLGRFQFQRSKIKDKRSFHDFANYLALTAASTLSIIVFSRGASYDIIITFPLTASLVSFFIFDQSHDNAPKRKYISLVLFYVFIGIALLAKGLIGIIFPLSIVALFYILSRRWPSKVFVGSLFWGSLLAIAIASVWYLPMYLLYGHRFVDEFFIQHHLQRFTSNKYLHPQPFYFFWWVLPLMTLPWLPFFLASVWKIIHHRATENTEHKNSLTFSRSHLLTFSAAWLLVPLIFFSFSGSKLPGYILPAVPPAIIFAAVFNFELISKSEKWRNTILLIATATFVMAIVLIILVVPRFAEADSVKTLIHAANERGYQSNRVLTLHTISDNAEFYAADRLLRTPQGKQRYLSGIDEVAAEIAGDNGRAVLVLIPLEYLSQLTNSEQFKTEVIKNNGDLAIAAVSAK
ncbi:MAG: ArnT family glycosyltransferase [Pyrinomonadaceae bacterium]